jgi:NitT/TauT family transport system substrate-binding protein
MVSVEFVNGWLAGAINGGYFAALEQGYFEEEGIDLTMNTGMGPSPVQLVGVGRAEFGLGDADEILLARAQGVPIVGLYATHQSTPRIIVYHEENPASSFEDFEGRTIYGPAGRSWWAYVKDQEQIETQEREYSIPAFLEDDNALIQAYYGDLETVYAAEAPDADLGALPVAPTGWDPYSSVLFTSERFMDENPEVVAGFVRALHRGWEFYSENVDSVNQYIDSVAEADASPEHMNLQAEAQWDIIFGEAVDNTGLMSEERWQATLDALVETGEIEAEVAETIDVTEAFTSEFHPNSGS